ncbi:MAG TPA: hypothetical protein VFM45_10815 [Anaeromyxobacteraceae bacterium]|nr:hypothetical protein [Anaeromyxobacteraceae bacterium]
MGPPPRGAAGGCATPGAQGGFGEALDRAGEAALDAVLAALVAPPAGEASPGLAAAGAASRAGEALRGAGAPLLARAIERVALAVNAGVSPSVTIQLGRSLDVRVEQGRAGVEVSLRPALGLSPLAEAELPLLVAALRARGVRVTRAGVEARRGRGARR